MLEITVAVAVASSLCLAFAATRMLGILGVALLVYMFPHAMIALGMIGGGAYLLFKYRSKSHV